jgi:hypothetical protein
MPEKDKLSTNEGDHRSLLNDQAFLEGVFKNKPHDLFVFLKLKKLAIALHVVSKVNEGEDLGVFQKLQSVSLSVISNVLYGGSKRQVSLRIIEMVTLLDIVSATGVISSMNCRVLKEEFFRLLDALDTMADFGKGEEVLFSKDFFEISGVHYYCSIILSNAFNASSCVRWNRYVSLFAGTQSLSVSPSNAIHPA